LAVFEIESHLYVVRGARSHVSAKCKRLCGKTLNEIIKNNLSTIINGNCKFLRYYKDVPNAIYLFKVVKEQLKDNIKIQTTYNKITIINENITTDYILDKIQEIFDQRLTVNVTLDDKKQVRPTVDKKIKNIRSKSKTMR